MDFRVFPSISHFSEIKEYFPGREIPGNTTGKYRTGKYHANPVDNCSI